MSVTEWTALGKATEERLRRLFGIANEEDDLVF
jgi:hypothetical protein